MNKTVKLLIYLLIILFSAETIIMLIFEVFTPANARIETIIDASGLVILTAPFFYYIIRKEQIKAEQALKENISNLEKIIEINKEVHTLQDAIDQSAIVAITDVNGIITYANEKFCIISQYSKTELIGNNHSIINSGYHTKSFFTDLWKTISSGKVWKGEIKNKRKDGSFYWVNTTIVPVFDKKNNISKFISIRFDITESKNLEQKNEKIQESLAEAQKLSKVGSWEVNLQDRNIFWSKEQYNIYDIPENIKGNELYTLWRSKVHHDDIEKLETQTKVCIAEKKVLQLEIRIIVGVESKTKYLLIRGYTINDNLGNPKLFVGSAQDITEQKKSKIELEKNIAFQNAILNGTNYSIISTNVDGVIVAFNKGAENMLGYHADEVINKCTPDIFHDKYEVATKAAELTKELGYEVEPGIDVFHAKSRDGITDINEWTYISKEGVRIPVKLAISCLRNENGDITGYLGIANDISQRKKAEQELIAAKELAEAASLAKSDFLANMSHEIRTPLNGVIGFSDLLMKTKLNESQQQYLSIIFQSANSLLDIINDILDFSKIEAGKLDLNIDKIDLLQLSSQIADVVSFQVQNKGLEMLLNLPSNLPRFIWADPVRLRQILVNLLSNAIKFTEKGEIELKVVLLEKYNSFSKFRFSVRDTGIGIDDKNIQKIFKAFEQEDNSTTRRFGGTGLGLSISNKLLHLMNETTLQVESKIGEGSVFYFDIIFNAEEGEPFDKHDLSKIKKALLVDDNANNRLIVQEMLKHTNILTDYAEASTDALVKLEADNNYDVIIIDYDMPDMDGLEIIRKIRENFKQNNQPIILLSSSSEDEKVLKACKELSINSRLIKPVKTQQLYDALAKVSQIETIETTSIPVDYQENLSKGNNFKILIADDNTVNLLLVKAIINKILPNATIIQVENGLEALMAFKKELPDMIFMDIQMPVMNGYEATSEIRKLSNGTAVPIIALTAGTVLGERDRCLEAGMNDYVSKPFVKDAIVKVLSNWIN